MTRVFNFKATNPYVWALVGVFIAGGFIYANHSTIALHFSSAKPVVIEGPALGHSMDGSDTLNW